MGVIGPDRETARLRIVAEPQLAGFEFAAILLAEKGHQYSVAQIRPVGVPVDVEPAGMDRIRPPFEHVEPEGIVGPPDAHVVRHEIQDLAEAVGLQRRVHSREGGLVTQLTVERIVVDDVIAMRAAGARFEVG